jgi:hypothetical protein
MALTNSCGQKNPAIELIAIKELPGFPSASAIEVNDGSIFLFGDDASYLLILDTSYRQLDTVQYISDPVLRLPKNIKPDIEASTLLPIDREKYLCAVGSFATEQRRKILAFPLNNLHAFTSLTDSLLLQVLNGLPEINIEGFTVVRSKLVFANRANTTNKTNKLIVINNIFGNRETVPGTSVMDLDLNSKNISGVSGLYYVAEDDILLFTASEEDTPSATQDGTIHDSYLGWVRDFSKKMNLKKILPDQLINLTDISSGFKKQKIESVCAEGTKNGEAVLHLAADNDNGQSRLFKMRLRLQ